MTDINYILFVWMGFEQEFLEQGNKDMMKILI